MDKALLLIINCDLEIQNRKKEFVKLIFSAVDIFNSNYINREGARMLTRYLSSIPLDRFDKLWE